MTEIKREPGCTCNIGTKDNPIYGGYARCSIHSPQIPDTDPLLPEEIDNITGTFTYDRVAQTEEFTKNPNFGKPKIKKSENDLPYNYKKYRV